MKSLGLLQKLKEAESEIEALKAYILEMKAKVAIYIPVNDDLVDKKLADYINNYPDRTRLKVMFLRESEGVYEFGSRKIAIKVEKDGIKIRVGGGYLSIDEFIDQYTPIELDKLARNNPLKKFCEKVAVQKTAMDR